MDTNDYLEELEDGETMNSVPVDEMADDSLLDSPDLEQSEDKKSKKTKSNRSGLLLRPGSWPLALRFSLLIFTLATVSLTVLGWYTGNTTERDVVDEVGKNFELQAESLSELTVGFFREKITQLQSLATMDAVRTVTTGKNVSHVGTGNEILESILELDALWIEAPDGDTFVNQIISPSSWVNPLTYQLIDFRESFPENAEIFITDRYGANIAATDRTSDYYQADEGWWQAAWNGGEGAIYISQPEYDESTQVTGVQIAVPIMDDNNSHAIGVVRSTVLLDELFNVLDQFQFGETGHSILFDSNSAVIYEPGDMAAEESSNLLSQDLLDHFQSDANARHSMVAIDQHGDEALFGHTTISTSAIPGDSVGAAKAQLEGWISQAINNLGWLAVVRQSTDESLAAVKQTQTNIGYVNLIIIFVSVLTGVYFARSLTKPLSLLSETAEELGRGNLDARVEITSGGEIGLVASTVNQMAEQVNSILTGLEDTIDDRTKELRERATEVEASQRVTFAATQRTSPEDFLQLLSNLIKDQFDVYHTQIYMLDKARENAVLAESTGYAGRQLLQRGHSLPINGQSLVAQAIRTGESVLVPDTEKDASHLPNPLLPLTKSELVVPLKLEGEIIGAIDIQDRVAGRFRKDSVSVFETMAEQVAFLFENNELLDQITRQSAELQRFTEQLRLAAEVANQIGTELDPEKLLAKAVATMQRQLGLYHVHIYLLDETSRQLNVAAGSGRVGSVLKTRGHSIALDNPTSVVARTASGRKPVVVADTEKVADHLPNPLLPNTRSELALPMMYGAQLIGVLDVQDDSPERFGQTDIDTLATLASQITTSYQTAKLVSERINPAPVEVEVEVEDAEPAESMIPDPEPAPVAHGNGTGPLTEDESNIGD